MIGGEIGIDCPECDNTESIMDHLAGEIVCDECGLVVNSTIIDNSKEWRAYTPSEYQNRTRVGPASSLAIHDKGLSTVIDIKTGDFTGRKLSPKQRAQAYRIEKWHRRLQVPGTSQSNLNFAMIELSKVAYKLYRPRNVLETSAYIYRKTIKKGIRRGKPIRRFVAACIYIACRQCNIIRHLGEVAEATQVSKRDAWRAYRFLMNNLETQAPRNQSPEFISKYVSQLSLTGEIEVIALQILDVATNLRLLDGRNPASIAAAAIYITCKITGESLVQTEIAKVGMITAVTLRSRYKEMVRMMEISLIV